MTDEEKQFVKLKNTEQKVKLNLQSAQTVLDEKQKSSQDLQNVIKT